MDPLFGKPTNHHNKSYLLYSMFLRKNQKAKMKDKNKETNWIFQTKRNNKRYWYSSMFLSEKEPKEIIASAHVSFGRRSSNHQDSKIKIFTRRWIITSVLFKVRRVCNIMGLVVPALTFNFNLHRNWPTANWYCHIWLKSCHVTEP